VAFQGCSSQWLWLFGGSAFSTHAREGVCGTLGLCFSDVACAGVAKALLLGLLLGQPFPDSDSAFLVRPPAWGYSPELPTLGWPIVGHLLPQQRALRSFCQSTLCLRIQEVSCWRKSACLANQGCHIDRPPGEPPLNCLWALLTARSLASYVSNSALTTIPRQEKTSLHP